MRTAVLLSTTFLLIAGLAAAALAQAPPQSGTLQAPKSGAAKPQVAPAPRAAPNSPVQQVAPFSSAPLAQPRPDSSLGRPAPARTPSRPPVVQAPRQAQKAKPPGRPAVPPAAAAAAAGAAVMTVPTAPPPERPDPAKGSATGQPLPRWASLRTDEVNLRTGPGTRYPVEWVYRRRDLPVQIEREFEVWRLVADPEGIKGWVHQATLTGRRSFVLKGRDQTLRRSAADDAAPVAVLRAGVVGRIRACEAAAGWCEVQAADYRGWLKREALWGLNTGEAVAN